jgi:hypothetical protein
LRVGFNFVARASRSAFDSDNADLLDPICAGAKADAPARAETKRQYFIFA